MGPVVDLLNTAGPFAGWVAFALVVLALLHLYASDKIVSSGRHQEQEQHFQQRLELQRRHYEEQLADIAQRADAHLGDKTYWRDVALDLMSTVAATVSRKDTDGAS